MTTSIREQIDGFPGALLPLQLALGYRTTSDMSRRGRLRSRSRRRAKMSLTIMTAIMSSRTVVMVLRTRKSAAPDILGWLFDMMLAVRRRVTRAARPSCRAKP
jgi:hypothetical protein